MTVKGMDLFITAGSGRRQRFTVIEATGTSCTFRRLRWWHLLWREILAGLRLGRRWIHYGWMLHVGICVVVGAAEGIWLN